MTTPRERIYDAEIAPLMAQIIEIAKAHKIPMFASFDLSSPLEHDFLCTTSILDPDSPASLRAASRLVTEGFAAFTVRRAGPGGPQ